MKRRRSAFTLIELLIVIAIIGILAAIAVPQFQNARVRARIGQAKAELRTLTLACHAYYLDQGMFPPEYDRHGKISLYLHYILSTPVAYLSPGAINLDPFCGFPEHIPTYYYHYPASQTATPDDFPTGRRRNIPDFIVVTSNGPDKQNNSLTEIGCDRCPPARRPPSVAALLSSARPIFVGADGTIYGGAYVYVPSNGLRSRGDIDRMTGETTCGLPTSIGG